MHIVIYIRVNMYSHICDIFAHIYTNVIHICTHTNESYIHTCLTLLIPIYANMTHSYIREYDIHEYVCE